MLASVPFRLKPSLLRSYSGIKCLSTASFQDEALQWGQRNPNTAQACLEAPPMNLGSNSGPCDSTGEEIVNFEQFWKRRGWKFPVENSDLRYAEALATHVLSAPLTMASALLPPDHKSELRTSNSTSSDVVDVTMNRNRRIRTVRWCCIGARAEASLPLKYWEEIVFLYSYGSVNSIGSQHIESDTSLKLHLDFIGPDLIHGRKPMEISCYGSKIVLRWPFAGKFHEYPENDSPYDAYILLNPGIGHPSLQEDWKPTLDLLFASKHFVESRAKSPSTLLLTAHSFEDAKRDALVLDQYRETTKPHRYTENPFASRIRYQDPLDQKHIVQPNHYMILL